MKINDDFRRVVLMIWVGGRGDQGYQTKMS